MIPSPSTSSFHRGPMLPLVPPFPGPSKQMEAPTRRARRCGPACLAEGGGHLPLGGVGSAPMETLKSYISGAWVAGTGKMATLVNPTTEEPVAQASTEGLDLGAAVAFARAEGGTALRALTFAQRGELLRAMSRAIHTNRDALIELAIKNGGNTRSDAKFDIDGASGTLAAYADLGKELGDQRFLLDGEGVQLGRSPRFFGQHISVPRHGVAVHVNAFNFPAWGLGEKAACALLAGVPVIE